MTRTMWISTAVLLIGLAIVTFVPPLRGDLAPGTTGGFGAAVLLPFGYFAALLGAAGLFMGWVRGRKVS